MFSAKVEVQNPCALLQGVGATLSRAVPLAGRSEVTSELETQELCRAWELGSSQAVEQEHKSEQTIREGRS